MSGVGSVGPAAAAAAAADGVPDRAALRRAAQGFEAIFVRRMLETARAADFGGEDSFGGTGNDQFTAMFDGHLADIAATRGAFGIAAAIEHQLGARLGPVSDPAPAPVSAPALASPSTPDADRAPKAR